MGKEFSTTYVCVVTKISELRHDDWHLVIPGMYLRAYLSHDSLQKEENEWKLLLVFTFQI